MVALLYASLDFGELQSYGLIAMVPYGRKLRIVITIDKTRYNYLQDCYVIVMITIDKTRYNYLQDCYVMAAPISGSVGKRTHRTYTTYTDFIPSTHCIYVQNIVLLKKKEPHLILGCIYMYAPDDITFGYLQGT